MKTLAVVIGNDEYHQSAKLDYAVADSQGMADVFNRLDYHVVHKTNVNNEDCVKILREIESTIPNYDASIFYFAGHGFQFNGENYLTSIECQIPPADHYACSRNSILLSEQLEIYKNNPDKINIVIIDACRRSFGRGTNPGYAPVKAPKGTLIAFSTSPDEGARDGGFDAHGVYTGALLQYIGREYLSIEELFKKVRRTVSNLTGGMQTPWEHTSLIGDFYFNTGQLVHSISIQYNDDVVKDIHFNIYADEFRLLIGELRSYDWYKQKTAILKLLAITPSTLDKNLQFILGRNLLQVATGGEFFTVELFKNLKFYISKYTVSGENHLLNGVLFEIYFNSYGEFRKDRFKTALLEDVMSIRKDTSFAGSFAFIGTLLAPYQEVCPFWIPKGSDRMIDIDVQCTSEHRKDWESNDIIYQVISRIMFDTTEITEAMRRYDLTDLNELALKKNVAHYLSAPEELVNIHSNIPLNRIAFAPREIIEANPFN